MEIYYVKNCFRSVKVENQNHIKILTLKRCNSLATDNPKNKWVTYLVELISPVASSNTVSTPSSGKQRCPQQGCNSCLSYLVWPETNNNRLSCKGNTVKVGLSGFVCAISCAHSLPTSNIFNKIKVGLWDHTAVCVCMSISPQQHSNAWIDIHVASMYIMPPNQRRIMWASPIYNSNIVASQIAVLMTFSLLGWGKTEFT
jgi:hypothetical protein